MNHIVVFDFDGVLANSFDSLYSFNKKAFSTIGVNLTRKKYKIFFRGNVHLGFREYIKNEGEYKTYLKFRKENIDTFYSRVRLYPGTKAFLKKIDSKYKIAIASSTHQKFISELLKKNNIEDRFSIVLGTKDYSKEKMLKTIKTKLRGSPSDIIMVSDTAGDINIAQQLGFKTVGVTWGFHSPNLLSRAGSNYIVKNFDELNTTLKILVDRV